MNMALNFLLFSHSSMDEVKWYLALVFDLAKDQASFEWDVKDFLYQHLPDKLLISE